MPAARHVAVAAAAGLVTAMVSGCGSGKVAPIAGSAVFNTHCATCHSLTGHSLPKQQGGDLGHLHLPRSELLQYTAEMPAIRGHLTARELRAVVGYLQSIERR